jgi:hypothetical protein
VWLHVKAGDAKSKPLRAESNHELGGLNGETRIIKRSVTGENQRSAIFSALPNTVARSSPAT